MFKKRDSFPQYLELHSLSRVTFNVGAVGATASTVFESGGSANGFWWILSQIHQFLIRRYMETTCVCCAKQGLKKKGLVSDVEFNFTKCIFQYILFCSNIRIIGVLFISKSFLTYVWGLWALVGVCIRRVYDVPPVTSVDLILLWQTRKDFTNNGILVETFRSCSNTSHPGELLGSSANWANLNSIKQKLVKR